MVKLSTMLSVGAIDATLISLENVTDLVILTFILTSEETNGRTAVSSDASATSRMVVVITNLVILFGLTSLEILEVNLIEQLIAMLLTLTRLRVRVMLPPILRGRLATSRLNRTAVSLAVWLLETEATFVEHLSSRALRVTLRPFRATSRPFRLRAPRRVRSVVVARLSRVRWLVNVLGLLVWETRSPSVCRLVWSLERVLLSRVRVRLNLVLVLISRLALCLRVRVRPLCLSLANYGETIRVMLLTSLTALSLVMTLRCRALANGRLLLAAKMMSVPTFVKLGNRHLNREAIWLAVAFGTSKAAVRPLFVMRQLVLVSRRMVNYVLSMCYGHWVSSCLSWHRKRVTGCSSEN